MSSYDTGTLGTALDPSGSTGLVAVQRGWGAGTGIMASGFFAKNTPFARSNLGTNTYVLFEPNVTVPPNVTLIINNSGTLVAPIDGPNVPPTITVVGRVVTVNLQGRGDTTINQVLNLIASTPAASALIKATIESGSGFATLGTNTTLVLNSTNSTDANNNVSLNPANGTVRGLAAMQELNPFTGVTTNRLFAVTSQGELMGLTPSASARHVFSNTYFVINDPESGNPIAFTGLSTGPHSLIDGAIDYSQVLFGVTATGRMYAFDTSGNLLNIFPRGANFIDGAGTAGSSGISFSSLDSNLFHLSFKNETEAGHGRNQAFNNSSDVQSGGITRCDLDTLIRMKTC